MSKDQEFLDACKRPMRDRPLPFIPSLLPERLAARELNPPDPDGCLALWDKYAMPAHIRAHSSLVALIAEKLGERLLQRGLRIDTGMLKAAALLHDLAKAYTIEHSGNHAHLGAAWVRMETGLPALAQPVFHHVHWPWALDLENESLLPSLVVSYADKRVKHDAVVGITERFDDLMRRYGQTERIRKFITASKEQGLALEKALSARLGTKLHEDTFDSRRLV